MPLRRTPGEEGENRMVSPSELAVLIQEVCSSIDRLDARLESEPDADQEVIDYWNAKRDVMCKLVGKLRDSKREWEQLERG